MGRLEMLLAGYPSRLELLKHLPVAGEGLARRQMLWLLWLVAAVATVRSCEYMYVSVAGI